eukprot:3551448-Pleurochrysis_carterae.AAC.5
MGCGSQSSGTDRCISSVRGGASAKDCSAVPPVRESEVGCVCACACWPPGGAAAERSFASDATR